MPGEQFRFFSESQNREEIYNQLVFSSVAAICIAIIRWIHPDLGKHHDNLKTQIYFIFYRTQLVHKITLNRTIPPFDLRSLNAILCIQQKYNMDLEWGISGSLWS